MKQEYGVFWPTQQELDYLLQEREIKPINKISLSEIYRRTPGETIDYQKLGMQVQQKFMQKAAEMAQADDCTIIYYNHKQRVSTTLKAIIIAMNFELYLVNKVEVSKKDE